jgi:hypothetical protein
MTETSEKPKGSGPWYAGFVVALGVSVDTSWRYFGERLHITGPERVLLFSVVEVMLLAAAWSMRAGVRRNGHPGSARAVAWALCGFQGYMAFELSGLTAGIARVVLGSGLALVALHQALGIEIKAKTGVRSGTLARVGRELRERALSRVNLGDDQRDALQRSRERAAVRAAEIATSTKPNRKALRRAVLKAGPDMRTLILDTRAALGSVDKLLDKVVDNPWTTPVPSAPRPRPSSAPTSGGPAINWDLDKVVRLVQEGQPDADIIAAGVSAKNLQRVRRVVRGLSAGLAEADLVRGDITTKFVQSIRKAMA